MIFQTIAVFGICPQQQDAVNNRVKRISTIALLFDDFAAFTEACRSLTKMKEELRTSVARCRRKQLSNALPLGENLFGQYL